MANIACLVVGLILLCVGAFGADGVSLFIGIGCVSVSTLAIVTGA